MSVLFASLRASGSSPAAPSSLSTRWICGKRLLVNVRIGVVLYVNHGSADLHRCVTLSHILACKMQRAVHEK